MNQVLIEYYSNIEKTYQELTTKITTLLEQQTKQEDEINQLLNDIQQLEHDINTIIEKQIQFNEQLEYIQKLQESIKSNVNQINIHLTNDEKIIYENKQRLIKELNDISEIPINYSAVPVHIEHEFLISLLTILQKQQDMLKKLID